MPGKKNAGKVKTKEAGMGLFGRAKRGMQNRTSRIDSFVDKASKGNSKKTKKKKY